MADDSDRTVTISAAPDGNGFLVQVEPPPEGDTFDARYPEYAGARGYGRGLRLHRGWKLVDLAEGTAS